MEDKFATLDFHIIHCIALCSICSNMFPSEMFERYGVEPTRRKWNLLISTRKRFCGHECLPSATAWHSQSVHPTLCSKVQSTAKTCLHTEFAWLFGSRLLFTFLLPSLWPTMRFESPEGSKTRRVHAEALYGALNPVEHAKKHKDNQKIAFNPVPTSSFSTVV